MTVRELYEPERGQRVPVRLWARAVSADTVRQMQRLASQPYVVEAVAAMADAHVADGVAVGTVFATDRTVVPRALGGDLGCGMSAIRLDVGAAQLDRRTRETIVAALERAIPTGDATHRGRGVAVPDALLAAPLSTRALDHARSALAPRHLGTLGGGNHFLELDRDAGNSVWLLVHSGSRGLGGAVAAHHTRAAASGEGDALAGLDVESGPGAAYLNDLEWAMTFARENRRALAARALEVIGDALGVAVDVRESFDVRHNFATRERWHDRELIVHRKGAIAAPRGGRALVPGSMGTASYVVEGLGNPLAFGSCSHGAGRVLTRRQARAIIAPKDLVNMMRRVVFPAHLAARLVEEAPSAYRDIGEVMDDQADLVTRATRLEPIAVLKG